MQYVLFNCRILLFTKVFMVEIKRFSLLFSVNYSPSYSPKAYQRIFFYTEEKKQNYCCNSPIFLSTVPIKIMFRTYTFDIMHIRSIKMRFAMSNRYSDNRLWLISHMQYRIASSKYAAYKLVSTARSNLLHNHSAPPNT